nr:xylulose kinase-1 [Tanacetum cinerariifolium]
MSLTFADTNNMVAYLNKSDASEGFNQVIDFINRSYIKYALTVNPNIYVSCIKQFWNTVVVKQTNDVTRLQALDDRKKVVITEAAIRDVLRLDDVEGVGCLPNEEIFAELAQSICQHEEVGKGFLGMETPLSEGMLVARVIEEEGDAEEKVRDNVDDAAAQGADIAVQGDDVHEPSIPSPTPPPQQSQDLLSTSQEALDDCAALTRRVEHLEYDKVAQALEITKLKRMVKNLEKGNMAKVLKLRRLTQLVLHRLILVLYVLALSLRALTLALNIPQDCIISLDISFKISLRHIPRLRNWGLISQSLIDLGSIKLALVESRLVEITPSVLSKITPSIEVVLIILNRRESGSNALTMSLSSATSDEMAGVEEFKFTLATTALALDCRTFDLLSMIFKQSEGILSKKLPPAAEFNES